MTTSASKLKATQFQPENTHWYLRLKKFTRPANKNKVLKAYQSQDIP